MPVPDYSDLERAFEVVNDARAREEKTSGFPVPELGADEKAEAYRWANGQELQAIVDTPGYGVLVYKLQKYMDESISELMNTPPENKDRVQALHAIAYADHQRLERLLGEVQADLAAAQSPPDVVKQSIRVTRGMPATN